jgi:hypothetical protein
MAVALIGTPADLCVIGKVSEASRMGCYVAIRNSLPVGTLLHVVLSRDGVSFATKSPNPALKSAIDEPVLLWI